MFLRRIQLLTMTHPGGLTMVPNDNQPSRPGEWMDRLGNGRTAAVELIACQRMLPAAVEVPGSAGVVAVLSADQREAMQRLLEDVVALQQPSEAQAVAPLDGFRVSQALMESSRDGLPRRHERLAALLGVDPDNCAAIHAEGLAYGIRLRHLGQRRGNASAPIRPANCRPWLVSMLRP